MKIIKTLFIAGAVALMTSCGSSTGKAVGNLTDSIADDVNDAKATVENTVSQVKAATNGIIEWNKDSEIKAGASMPTIIDFSATWCGPCQQFKPVFHKVAEKYAGKARFITVDVDACPAVAQQYGVQSIPQITVLKSDGTVDSHVGMVPEAEFETLVKNAL